MTSRSRIALAVAFAATLGSGAALHLTGASSLAHAQPAWRFHLEEATIPDVHRAIREGQITCRGLVQAYVNRAPAFNGVATRLVTRDGRAIAPAAGTVRAGAPLEFPAETVPASAVLPDLNRYAGPPIEFGRMEATASDPSVQQQFGVIVGTPDAGQLNALSTLNLRGERSVTCKGAFDQAPAEGPLPLDAPAVCEEFRKLPDALERASALDANYGTAPDLAAMPRCRDGPGVKADEPIVEAAAHCTMAPFDYRVGLAEGTLSPPAIRVASA